MKAKPTDAEAAAAIAAALLARTALRPQAAETQAPSGWLEAARREAVTPYVATTWRS